MKPFPWAQAIGFGLGILKLPPEQFWSMTPRDAPLDRGAFGDLMKRFPDER